MGRHLSHIGQEVGVGERHSLGLAKAAGGKQDHRNVVGIALDGEAPWQGARKRGSRGRGIAPSAGGYVAPATNPSE